MQKKMSVYVTLLELIINVLYTLPSFIEKQKNTVSFFSENALSGLI